MTEIADCLRRARPHLVKDSAGLLAIALIFLVAIEFASWI